jgi:hypothetical protein
VALTQELLFREGKPLSPTAKEGEGRTILIDYNSSGEISPQCHIYMASLHEHGDEDKPEREYDDELLVDVFATSARQMPAKMKTRSTGESGGSRMPNMPSADGTRKPVHRMHLTAETSTVPLLQLMIASTTL